MFQATLGHRDPDSWLRWTIAIVGMLGCVLSVGNSVLAYGMLAWLRFVLAWLWVLLMGGPVPVMPTWGLQPVPEFVELVVDEEPEPVVTTLEGAGYELAEPDELIGAAPVAEDPAAKRAAQTLAVDARARKTALLGTLESGSGLLAILSTSGASDGAMMDAFSGGDTLVGSDIFARDLDGIGLGGVAVSGVGAARGSGGLGSVSGGGGTGSGGLGGGRVGGIANKGGLPTPTRSVLGKLPAGHAGEPPVSCLVRVSPDARRVKDRLHVSRCPEWAHAAARGAVERAGKHEEAGQVPVVLR